MHRFEKNEVFPIQEMSLKGESEAGRFDDSFSGLFHRAALAISTAHFQGCSLDIGLPESFGASFLQHLLLPHQQPFHPFVKLRATEPAKSAHSGAATNTSISTKLNFPAPSTQIIHLQLARSESLQAHLALKESRT